jgi:hypothetical protein
MKQDSERLFINDFLYPLLGANIQHIEPQRPFLDRSGKCRRIDFAYIGPRNKIALEVNGETYHTEGIIPDAMFDENSLLMPRKPRRSLRAARRPPR